MNKYYKNFNQPRLHGTNANSTNCFAWVCGPERKKRQGWIEKVFANHTVQKDYFDNNFDDLSPVTKHQQNVVENEHEQKGIEGIYNPKSSNCFLILESKNTEVNCISITFKELEMS